MGEGCAVPLHPSPKFEPAFVSILCKQFSQRVLENGKHSLHLLGGRDVRSPCIPPLNSHLLSFQSSASNSAREYWKMVNTLCIKVNQGQMSGKSEYSRF